MCTEHTAAVAHGHGAGLTRRAALVGGASVAVSAALAGTAVAGTAPAPIAADVGRGPQLPRPGRRGLQDLTYTVSPDFPAFVLGEEARRRTLVNIVPDGYYLQEWTLTEHTGTHLDAPGHFTAGGRLSTDLALEELLTPAVVIDIAERAASDPDTLVTVDDVRRFERRHGRVPRGAAVLMYSGWGVRVGDADAYRNPDAAGVLHFPGFDPETTQWLLDRRRIASLGVDTLSIDPGNSASFATHLVLTGADRYGLENLANLERIPPTGAAIVVGLIPYQDGSGGQSRVFAHW